MIPACPDTDASRLAALPASVEETLGLVHESLERGESAACLYDRCGVQ